jgi:hypothetical protein
MAKFWKIVKKYPCCAVVALLHLMVITVRVQGGMATTFEQVFLALFSCIVMAACTLYFFLYMSGSLNPGDKPIINFGKLGEKLLGLFKGNSKDHH